MPGKRARQEEAARQEAARRAQADTVPTLEQTPKPARERPYHCPICQAVTSGDTEHHVDGCTGEAAPEMVIVRTFERPARIEAEQ